MLRYLNLKVILEKDRQIPTVWDNGSGPTPKTFLLVFDNGHETGVPCYLPNVSLDCLQTHPAVQRRKWFHLMDGWMD